MIVSHDIETQSFADIKKVGGALYADHSSTRIACLQFMLDDGPLHLLDFNHWRTRERIGSFWHDEISFKLDALARDPGVKFAAHNAAFEQYIWHSIAVPLGFPPIDTSRYICTMAQASRHGLPASLEKCAKTLRLPVQKDSDGYKIMMKLCKPRKGGICEWHGEVDKYCCGAFEQRFWEYEDCPEDFETLYHYCGTDVEALRAIWHRLPKMDHTEQWIWVIDQRMNQRGMYFDLPTVSKAKALADEHTKRLTRSFQNVTNGAIETPGQRDKLLAWSKQNGVDLPNLQKATVHAALETDLPPQVAAALNLRAEASKTSLAKLGAMLNMSDHQGWHREMLTYHAAHTGRWGGRGIQLQNLPRPKVRIDTIVKAVQSLDYETLCWLYDGYVAEALSSSLRGMIVAPPGERLLVADFAQMEARVIAWLANQLDVLEAFARGDDLYSSEASKIYGHEINQDEYPEERQVGKVAVLALGYGGGIRAFAKMARNYGVDLRAAYFILYRSASIAERENAEWSYRHYLKTLEKGEVPVNQEVAFVADLIKQRWREGNEHIKAYWGELEYAAVMAAASKSGQPYYADKLMFFKHDIWLCCKLPSNRVMFYPYPKVTYDQKGNAKLGYYSAKYGRITTYGGKLAENVTQAVQRDLLRDALIRLTKANYTLAFHVHDEIISSMPSGRGSLSEFLEVMKAAPTWSHGIPIDVTGWEGERYGKH